MIKYILVLLFLIGGLTLSAQSAVEGNAEEINIYPNPANDYFMVDNDVAINRLQVFNVIGRQMKDYLVLNQQQQFNISDLNSGLYLVRFLDEKGNIITTKRINKR